MNQKIDVTSTVLEKGIDVAKNFVDKLIMPAIEETGLLIKDQVTFWKFKNQIRMLNKAKEYCENNNISPKTISLKLLCPLLDYSGVEEDEVLQDKRAILLGNMVDSEQNIENHVFPYILSQLSTNEFLILEQVYDSKLKRVSQLDEEIARFIEERPNLEKKLNEEIKIIDEKTKSLEADGKRAFDKEVRDLRHKKAGLSGELSSMKYTESRLISRKNKAEIIPEEVLASFELSNLTRLGLVKEEKEYHAGSQTLEIPNPREDSYSRYTTVDFDIEVESTVEHILTELGELFISACKEKKSQS